MAFARVSILRCFSILKSKSISPPSSSSSSSSSSPLRLLPLLSQSQIPSTRRSLTVTASISIEKEDSSSASTATFPKRTDRWKPMCLYYTQGKCTMLEDPAHLEKFNHDCSIGLQVNVADVPNLRPQNLDYILVLDLEGKVEILEFPVVMIDAKTMKFVDFFHRFVRPTKMSEQRVEEYIEGKYGKLGVDRVWHDTSISFPEVLQQFESWVTDHCLWEGEAGGALRRAAFVTCGNWDLKTKIPQQCKVSSVKLPPYFMEWINIKDIYLNFYNRRATGMVTMMKELGIPLVGSHHLGIDDTKNIVRVLQHMLADGALMQITARRSSSSHENVEFLFKNRV